MQRDEHETGRRAILNAGHTIGHAIEQASGYAVTHGEGVAIGLVVEARDRRAPRRHRARHRARDRRRCSSGSGFRCACPRGVARRLRHRGDPQRQEESRERDSPGRCSPGSARCTGATSRDGPWRCPRRCSARRSAPSDCGLCRCAGTGNTSAGSACCAGPSTKMLISRRCGESAETAQLSTSAATSRCGCRIVIDRLISAPYIGPPRSNATSSRARPNRVALFAIPRSLRWYAPGEPSYSARPRSRTLGKRIRPVPARHPTLPLITDPREERKLAYKRARRAIPKPRSGWSPPTSGSSSPT